MVEIKYLKLLTINLKDINFLVPTTTTLIPHDATQWSKEKLAKGIMNDKKKHGKNNNDRAKASPKGKNIRNI